MIQGIATFPGVQYVSGATFSFTHGISPSVCALEIAPQAGGLAETGTLAFDFGGVHIEWPDCKVDYASLEWNGRGQIIRLNILDRRWKWAFGRIGGRYNVYGKDGEILDGTEKTPVELAELCLEAMGEEDAGVIDLPEDPRPEVHWDGDVPAETLARLCDMLGSRVILRPDNTVTIHKTGWGLELPDGAIQEDSLQINPPEMPDKVGVLGAPARFQDDLELEAVGIDSDTSRTIKPIDDLAYKPVRTWGCEFAGQFSNVLNEHGEVAWELARRSVFRMYRVKFPATVRGAPEEVSDIHHLIVGRGQVVTYVDTDGQTADTPAQVIGEYYRWTDSLGNTAAGTLCDQDFVLDPASGIVTFRNPVFRSLATTTMTPAAAKLKLRTAYSVLGEETMSPYRLVVESDTGGTFGTQTQWFHRPELVLNYIDGQVQNEKEIRDEALYQLEGIKATLQTQTPQVRKYAGLVEVNLDGAIQHVVYTIGGQGATTTISRNTEQRDYALPYKLRRLRERQTAWDHMLANIQAAAEETA